MKAISMAQARTNLSSVVTETSSGGETFIIHSRGVPKAVLIGIEQYREIEATLEEMGDPKARKLLEAGKNDIEKGRTRAVEDIFGDSLV